MKNRVFLILIIVVSILSACELLGSKSENGGSKDLSLTETLWWLQAFHIEGGKKMSTGPMEYGLSFSDRLTISGNTWATLESGQKRGFNVYSGQYSLEGSTLQIFDIIGTYVGEPQGAKSYEYYLALQNAVSYDIQGNRLIIFYGESGDKALYFKAGERFEFPE